ncbi:MAG TPA: hypothetical protein P5055_19345, partial [Candidatus Paceibacterota bacterium]|nr:hypothetical protein [Candidatus Paceibacterota bacterium]
MKNKEIAKKAAQFAAPFRITNGRKFHLKTIDPQETLDFKGDDKTRAKEALATGIAALADLQDMLYAQDRWAVLLIFQAMDAAGKDGAIKHVMSGLNPQGCQVFSFKSPSAEELDHDYLWRCMKCLPERGRIGIFNRSYYEETLVVRVHSEYLEKQKLPQKLIDKGIWKRRFRDIRGFERYLTHNGIAICKFFLHVSKKEQKRRFLERLEKPEKNWKFSSADLEERARVQAIRARAKNMPHVTAEMVDQAIDSGWSADEVVGRWVDSMAKTEQAQAPRLVPADSQLDKFVDGASEVLISRSLGGGNPDI